MNRPPQLLQTLLHVWERESVSQQLELRYPLYLNASSRSEAS
jgi:hypothetical protein